MSSRLKLLLIFILSVTALLLLASQKANPDAQLLFGLKRVQEKHFLNFKTSPKDKVNYMSVLLNNRLEELSNVVKNKNYNYVLQSANRYFTLAGQITDLIVTSNMTGEVESTKKQFSDHGKILYDLYVYYPKNTDNVEYKYIEDDINYLKIYLDKLSKI